MGPASQRLETGDFARLQVDQRLIEKPQLVLVERAAKLGLDGEAAARLCRLLGFVNLRLPCNLRLLDGELRIAKQFLRVLPRVHERDADGTFDPDLEVRELERRGHHLLDALRRLQCVFDAAAQRHQHAELVAAGPSKRVAGPQRQDQSPGKGDQQLVSGEAAHRFVDAAETQHVDDEHGMLEVACNLRSRVLDRFGERETVG